MGATRLRGFNGCLAADAGIVTRHTLEAMRTKALNPQRLDVGPFAREDGHLEGQLPVPSLARVHASRPDGLAVPDGETVSWQVQGEMRKIPDGRTQPWLHLSASLSVTLQCQRCLGPVTAPVTVESDFRFVPTEAQAEAEDVDAEEEVLALPTRLNLVSLIEDEILLALPLVPRHDHCPQPLPMAAGDIGEEVTADGTAEPSGEGTQERPHPFAALAALKSGKLPGSGD